MSFFVIWDTTTRNLKAMLEYLPPDLYQVPGLEPSCSDLFSEVVAKGIAASKLAIAFIDIPNANVGFELGYAAGYRKPLTLVRTYQTPRHDWQTRPPLAGILSVKIQRIDDLMNIPSDAYIEIPSWKPTPNGLTLLLCPRESLGGSACHYWIRNHFHNLRIPPENAWNLFSLPQILQGVGRVIWIITDYSEGADIRDGVENSCNAVIAGYAKACGAEVTVLRDKDSRSVVDVETFEIRYSGKQQFQENFLRYMADSPMSEEPTPDIPQLNFRYYMESKLHDFVGRKWLKDKILDFQNRNQRSITILDALPGMGKSAFVSALIQEYDWVHHFNIEPLGITTFAQFLIGIYAQLANRFRLSILPPSKQDFQNGLYLQRLLGECGQQAMAKEEKLVLVVDALDESAGLIKGAQPLFLPTIAPFGVHLVATIRTGMNSSLYAEHPCLPLSIDPSAQENRDDILAFLNLMMDGPLQAISANGAVPRETMIQSIMDASQGNFMYVRAVVDEFISSKLALSDLSKLPEGLIGYYERHWNRIRSGAKDSEWETLLLPILRVLSILDKPVTIHELQEILRGAFPEVSAMTSDEIWNTISKWREFLLAEPSERGPMYQIYHPSFREFLATKEEVAGAAFSSAAHSLISDVLMRKFLAERGG